jgi:MOSC domain-containing protein YiiM
MGLEMKEMLATMPQVGCVQWIGLRPGRGEPVVVVEQAEATLSSGLEGDRFSGGEGAKRQVTLIQREHIDAVRQILGRDSLEANLLRRNIVVSGINLQALKEKHFQIGDAVLYGTGNCPPCSQMEKALGPGGYNAMRGHGGITARVVTPGTIHVNSEVKMTCENPDD